MTGLSWTIVLNTPLERVALKLTERIHRRLAVDLHDVWVRPWGERREMFAVTFDTDASEDVAEALDLAGRLAGAWTVVLPGDRRNTGDVAFRGWVPQDYRTFTLEGLAEAGFVSRRPGSEEERAEVGVPGGVVRRERLRTGLDVQVVRRE